MTLQQLQYVLISAESGSLNRAAERLFISQPTLTNAMHDVEAEAGITIFNRTRRGISLTKEGEEFVGYARSVCQQFELLKGKYIEHHDVKKKFGVSTQHYSFVVKAFVETVKKFDPANFEFAVRETKTVNVIRDVSEFRSDFGILYRSDHNRKVLSKMLDENNLEFTKLIDCNAYVYIWKNHPLAKCSSINLKMLEPYPCLSFEQGEMSSSYFSEEILAENEYARLIHTNDRATMLNLMVGLDGYTLCSGIICEELNGTDYIAVPFEEDEENRNLVMEIGYLRRRGTNLDEIGETFLTEMKKYLKIET